MKRIILEIFCNPEKRSIKRDSHLHFLRESILGHLSFIEFGPIYRSYLENGRRFAHIRWIPVVLLCKTVLFTANSISQQRYAAHARMIFAHVPLFIFRTRTFIKFHVCLTVGNVQCSTQFRIFPSFEQSCL